MSYREDVKQVKELLTNIEAAIPDNLNTIMLDLLTLIANKQVNEVYIPQSISEYDTHIFPVVELNILGNQDTKNKKIFLNLGAYNENIEALIDQTNVNDSTKEILLNTHEYLSHINQYHVKALGQNEVSSRFNLNTNKERQYPDFIYPEIKEQCENLLMEKSSKKLSFK